MRADGQEISVRQKGQMPSGGGEKKTWKLSREKACKDVPPLQKKAVARRKNYRGRELLTGKRGRLGKGGITSSWGKGEEGGAESRNKKGGGGGE